MVASEKILDKGFIELIDFMGNDDTIVSSARVSYLGESKGEKADKGLINYMMKHGHTSPFEHVIFQWRIKCPLFVRSQWHRHRTWSYNELSRRYTSENIEFYIPNEWRIQHEENRQGSQKSIDIPNDKLSSGFSSRCIDSLDYYHWLLDKGIAREMARMVLPQNMYTVFYGTVNLHNLFHFIELRSDSHAQWEIQQYAKAMEEMIQQIVPWSYEAGKS